MSPEREPAIASTLIENYLNGFVARGGASVKLICGHELKTGIIAEELLDAADNLGYATAQVDCAETKVHFVQELFWAVARQLPWLKLAERFARKVVAHLELTLPGDEPLMLSRLAELNDITPAQFHRLAQQSLRKLVLKNPNYTRTFKSVILALTGAAFDDAGIDRAQGIRVIEWLRGEPTNMKALREVNISRKIGRQNARALLMDMSRWLRDAGMTGLMIVVDISRYAVGKNLLNDGANTYTPAAAQDLYETIRQFIDSNDDAVGLFLAFTTRTEFLVDERRGISSYDALKMRVIDDVYDSDRPNLMAPLLMAPA